MFLPRLLLAESFELPSPYTSCVRDCPANAFFALDSEPAFVGAFLRPVGVVLVFLVMTAVVLRLRRTASRRPRRSPGACCAGRRRRDAPRGAPRRGESSPGRSTRPPGRSTSPPGSSPWRYPRSRSRSSSGLLQWRLYAERTLQSLAACLRDLPDPATLRRAFADAFKDPSIEIVFPAGDADDGWLDSRARARGAADAGHRRAGSPTCATTAPWSPRSSTTKACVRRPELVEAGASMAAVVLDNQRLAAQAEVSIRELLRSRARIASSAERRAPPDRARPARRSPAAARRPAHRARARRGRRAAGPRAGRRAVCASSSTS